LRKSPEYFLLLPSPWQNLPWFPTARSSHADSYIAVVHYYINALPPADFRQSRCARKPLPADDVAVAPAAQRASRQTS
jgi:hypothetical protein